MSFYSELKKGIPEEVFRPTYRNVVFPLDGFENNRNGHHVDMGYFYELLSMALFGGKVGNHIYVKNGSQPRKSKPDVIGRKRIVESKACRTGHSCIFYDSQQELYGMLQIRRPRTKIYFAIFRHSFKGIKSYRGTVPELYESLAASTKLLIVLPHSVVRSAWKDDAKPGLTRRYDESECHADWTNCTIMNSTAINGFYFETKENLERFDFDPGLYTWKKYRTPKKLSVAGNAIVSFPMCIIHDKNHDEWIHGFEEDFEKDLPF
jgi:hypothetical protein